MNFLKRYETNAYQRIAKLLVIIRTIVVFEGLSVTKVVKNERERERALLIEIHFNLYKVRFVVFVTVFMPLPNASLLHNFSTNFIYTFVPQLF